MKSKAILLFLSVIVFQFGQAQLSNSAKRVLFVLDASGSIPTGSDWLMIADTTSSVSSSYNLHMYHREEEPSGSIYIQEIWSCEDNQRTCLQ